MDARTPAEQMKMLNRGGGDCDGTPVVLLHFVWQFPVSISGGLTVNTPEGQVCGLSAPQPPPPWDQRVGPGKRGAAGGAGRPRVLRRGAAAHRRRAGPWAAAPGPEGAALPACQLRHHEAGAVRPRLPGVAFRGRRPLAGPPMTLPATVPFWLVAGAHSCVLSLWHLVLLDWEPGVRVDLNSIFVQCYCISG